MRQQETSQLKFLTTLNARHGLNLETDFWPPKPGAVRK
jgi:hypothetical protein